ncbi:pentatricopeptide repeat-containing protein At3g12770-like [Gastrolobium bilobum]|uniref:pentatricopeptide repeat-containing protein At3g12770-like n=1 Tax=Gastrolobium bilobum TaxID=150636 RepID=UPI002AAFE8D9|nr:pentatricopeptide repeat-containing protein At3g12770-like [Gastrolobium bilobum]
MSKVIQFLHQSRVTNNVSDIKKLHGHLLRTGMLFVSHDSHTQLVLTYAACLPKIDLRSLYNFFKCMNSINPLHFNVIISDFCRKGSPFLALTAFSFMHTNGVPLDTYALCSTLNASSKVKDVNFGKQIHAHVGKSGYGEAGLWVQELELVRKMPMLKLKYDHFTLSAALRACTGLSAVEMGRQLHSYLLRTTPDIESDVFLQSALIEMYGKCGLVKKAWQVFKLAGMEIRKERIRDLVLWTSMLGVFGRNGLYKEVIDLYNEMLVEGIRPDGIAFLTVISACGHTGQVQAGVKYFESMADDFKLDPGPEHYSCLVDLLCRAGELQKAWELLNQTLYKGRENCIISMWGALLNACVDRGNIELGKLAAQRALELDPQNVGICIMLSNLYARFGMWDEIGQLRVLIKARRLRKDVGCSWVQVTS